MTDKELEDSLVERFKDWRFEPQHIERRAEDSEWAVRLAAINDGTPVRGLAVTIKSPVVLSFEKRYEWLLLCSAPFWVVVKIKGRTITFSRNTSKVTGTYNSNLNAKG